MPRILPVTCGHWWRKFSMPMKQSSSCQFWAICLPHQNYKPQPLWHHTNQISAMRICLFPQQSTGKEQPTTNNPLSLWLTCWVRPEGFPTSEKLRETCPVQSSLSLFRVGAILSGYIELFEETYRVNCNCSRANCSVSYNIAMSLYELISLHLHVLIIESTLQSSELWEPSSEYLEFTKESGETFQHTQYAIMYMHKKHKHNLTQSHPLTTPTPTPLATHTCTLPIKAHPCFHTVPSSPT